MRVGWMMMDCFFYYLFRGKRATRGFFFDLSHISPFKLGLQHLATRFLSFFHHRPYIRVLSLSQTLCLCLCLCLSSTSGNKNSLLRRTSQENARVYASTQGTHTSKQKWHSLREAFLRSGSARRTTSARKAPRRVAKTDR